MLRPGAVVAMRDDRRGGIVVQARLVGPVGPQGVVDVGKRDDAREQRDVAAGQPARITAAIEPLVMVEGHGGRSEEHTSELQSLMRISYAVFCLKKNKRTTQMHDLYKHNP